MSAVGYPLGLYIIDANNTKAMLMRQALSTILVLHI